MITLKKFNTLPEAATLTEMLQKAEIEYTILREPVSADSIFAGNTYSEELHIQVKDEDAEACEKLMENIEEIAIDKLEKDYYLFEFSDIELIDILKNPDEWGLNDYYWSYQILQSRGTDPSSEEMEEWKKNRYKELSKPEMVTNKYIILSYLGCIIGGLVGIFMGRHLTRFQKILPDGKKILAFDEESRKKGSRIIITGYILLILWTVASIVIIIM